MELRPLVSQRVGNKAVIKRSIEYSRLPGDRQIESRLIDCRTD